MEKPLVKRGPGTHSTKSSWAHDYDLVKIISQGITILMTQSGYSVAYVTTAYLSNMCFHKYFHRICIMSTWTYCEISPRASIH